VTREIGPEIVSDILMEELSGAHESEACWKTMDPSEDPSQCDGHVRTVRRDSIARKELRIDVVRDPVPVPLLPFGRPGVGCLPEEPRLKREGGRNGALLAFDAFLKRKAFRLKDAERPFSGSFFRGVAPSI
jgi:hypothetical protein